MILTRSVVVVVFFAFGGVAWHVGLDQFDRRVVVIDVVALGLLVVAVLAAAVGHEGDGGVVGHFRRDVGVDRGRNFRHQDGRTGHQHGFLRDVVGLAYHFRRRVEAIRQANNIQQKTVLVA